MPFKHFLRAQRTEAGTLKHRSKDFILVGLNVFKQLVRHLNAYTLNLCYNVLDYLIECAQKPCAEN